MTKALKLRVFKVKGNSMQPTFKQNDYVFCWRWLGTQYNVGDLVVADHPHLNIIVKRIIEVDTIRGVLLGGDNPNSTPADQIGWLDIEKLIGKIFFKI